MRSIVLGAAMVLFVGAGVAAQDGTSTGEQVFAAQKCSICHSIAGTGNPKGSLDAIGSKLKPDEIRMWIVDAKAMTAKTKPQRKPEMRQYSLSKEDVDALVAYLAALKK